jgi:hypothetical protein
MVLCLACTRTPTVDSTVVPSGDPAPATTTSVPEPEPKPQPLLGAYYYFWNPDNLASGYLRGRLQPPQTDMAAQAAVPGRGVQTDIAEATAHGIDFFALNWWPRHPERNRRIDEDFLTAPNVGDIKFCIFYETQDFSYDPATGTSLISASVRRRLVADLAEIGRRYFDHPSYLRVGGEPVVVLYLTRTLVGQVEGTVSEARAAWRAAGHEVTLVGDEVFWRVAPHGPGRVRPVPEPQPARALLFDGLTAYNAYDAATRAHGGYGSQTTFLADVRGLYQRYRDVFPEVPVIPSVFPGYNDRGARSLRRHVIIPRQWAPGEADGTFLARYLDDVALPLVDPRLPMVFVTTWNEWNEDTAVEPVAESAPTTVDDSPSGADFTDGYAYAGHGRAYLEVLRERFGDP